MADTLTRGRYTETDESRRRRVLGELLTELRALRSARPEWYVWAVEGQPRLSEDEYAAVGWQGKRRRK